MEIKDKIKEMLLSPDHELRKIALTMFGDIGQDEHLVIIGKTYDKVVRVKKRTTYPWCYHFNEVYAWILNVDWSIYSLWRSQTMNTYINYCIEHNPNLNGNPKRD